MAKHDKILEKLRAKPPPAGIKWSELKSLLENLGYTLLKGKGSRRKFFHHAKNAMIICHEPHPSPDVDKGCIADVIEHLKTNGFINVQAFENKRNASIKLTTKA